MIILVLTHGLLDWLRILHAKKKFRLEGWTISQVTNKENIAGMRVFFNRFIDLENFKIINPFLSKDKVSETMMAETIIIPNSHEIIYVDLIA